MNKFYKSIKLTALVMAIVSLAGCKTDTDTLGITYEIANKTLLGIYTYTAVDSTTMQVFKKECAFKRDNAGNQTGYYRESRSGQGALTDVTINLKWEAVMAADKLSMEITAQLENGTSKTFKWADGNVVEQGQNYEKSLSGLSNIDVQNTILSNMENTDFDGKSTVYHEHLDTVPYLAWNAKSYNRNGVAPADTAAKKAELEAKLEPFQDTIIWYLRTQVPEHTLGRAHLDTVFVGGDTTFVLVNAVYVDPTPNSKGNHLITYLVSEIKKRVEQVNDRPETAIVSTMEFKRVGESNSAIYTYHMYQYSKEYYTDPTSEKATTYDSIYSIVSKGWVVTSFSNAKKFDIMLSGTQNIKVKATEAGAETRNTDETKEDAFTTLGISDFDKNKGVATQANLKYTLKK